MSLVYFPSSMIRGRMKAGDGTRCLSFTSRAPLPQARSANGWRKWKWLCHWYPRGVPSWPPLESFLFLGRCFGRARAAARERESGAGRQERQPGCQAAVDIARQGQAKRANCGSDSPRHAPQADLQIIRSAGTSRAVPGGLAAQTRQGPITDAGVQDMHAPRADRERGRGRGRGLARGDRREEREAFRSHEQLPRGFLVLACPLTRSTPARHRHHTHHPQRAHTLLFSPHHTTHHTHHRARLQTGGETQTRRFRNPAVVVSIRVPFLLLLLRITRFSFLFQSDDDP